MNSRLSSDSDFVHKLRKVVEANLADEKFGVKELAQKTRISRTQLHRKIKAINNQSVSQFIREIRLNRAKEMLRRDEGTVSEIAYKVGFGSPSYFIKCFHEYYGYPPGVVLKLPAEADENDIESSEHSGTVKSSESSNSRNPLLFKLSIVILGILTIATITIYIYKNIIYKKESKSTEKSIAILPLKNLSDNKDIQYLADGIMEDILNRLSHVQELKVKSRISSQQYRNPEMSLPQIAKEMNVSYVVEGSIMNHENKVRIIVQLIEANTDNHLWSKEYNQDLNNILDFTSDVSRQITEELQVVLTTDEISGMKKNSTENTEAYNLYLLGRYFWHRKTNEDLIACIKYYEKAIEIDSTYALAYAGMADAFNSLSGFGLYPYEEGIQKCKNYALKAISLDNKMAEGHASLGDCIADYFWDWDLAEKELKRAINLNPNFALAYRYYADYLITMGRNEEAQNNLNKSRELDPLALATYGSLSQLHYNEGKFDEVLKDLEMRWGFLNNTKSEHFNKFKVELLQSKYDMAFDELKQYLSFDSPIIDYSNDLDKIYSESGMKGVMQWFVEYYKRNEANNFQIASFYVYLEDYEKAIDYLEKQYNDKNIRHHLTIIKSDYDYKALHGHPRFEALLKKMNLAD